MFIIGYFGYGKKATTGLYRSAVSLEFLHDFMLIHDDIIDKSETRRGKPSMHLLLNRKIAGKKHIKFSGQDLAIVVGDVMYAMAINSFLSVKENLLHKEMALKKLTEAAMYTGGGEFIELIYGSKDISNITEQEINKIYDLKTANYTFASPLMIGATLAGAETREIKKIYNYGISLGRAFQIKDDVLGMFGDEKKTGKSNLTDLKESKKTILIWLAYKLSDYKNKKEIRRILNKQNINRSDLKRMRHLVISSGALDKAKQEIDKLINKSELFARKLAMRKKYKDILSNYAKELLSI